MLPISTLVSLIIIICTRRVSAQIQPTTPGPNETYTAGSDCAIAWVPDSSGTWTNVTIDLMSGSNNNMSLVTNVVNGLDGTDDSLTPFSWTCPEVDPYSTIYFYQFTNGEDVDTRTWTTRFTITSLANETEPPENPQQPDGENVPWGLGYLISDNKARSNSSMSSTRNNSTMNRTSTLGFDHPSSLRPSTASHPSATSTRGAHGHKGGDGRNGTEGRGDDREDANDDGDDDGTAEPATSARQANIAGAQSSAARATGIAHSQGTSSPPSDSDSGASTDGSSDSDSDSQQDEEETRSQYHSYPDSDKGSQAQAQPPYQPPGYKTPGDCQCGIGEQENGGKTQVDVSSIVSSIAPSVIIALVVLYL